MALTPEQENILRVLDEGGRMVYVTGTCGRLIEADGTRHVIGYSNIAILTKRNKLPPPRTDMNGRRRVWSYEEAA